MYFIKHQKTNRVAFHGKLEQRILAKFFVRGSGECQKEVSVWFLYFKTGQIVNVLTEGGMEFVYGTFSKEAFYFNGNFFTISFGGQNFLGSQVDGVVFTVESEIVRIVSNDPAVLFDSILRRVMIFVRSGHS